MNFEHTTDMDPVKEIFPDRARVAVLVSGGGTNLQAILDAEKNGVIKSGEVVLVISNNSKAYALERAENHGIEHMVINRKQFLDSFNSSLEKSQNGETQHVQNVRHEDKKKQTEIAQKEFENELIRVLDEHRIDLIVLAGFMSILSERFTSHYPERIINVHPSLIPAFCGQGFYGLKVHEAALEKGVKITGATVHFVNEIPDGGRIISQKAVEVLDGDTPEILQRRVMEQAEWKLLPEAVENISRTIKSSRS